MLLKIIRHFGQRTGFSGFLIDTPEGIRRQVLAMYAIITPLFTLSFVIAPIGSAYRPLYVMYILFFMVSPMLLLTFRSKPGLPEWLYTGSFCPLTCMALAGVGCQLPNLVFLPLVCALLLWVATIFSRSVVLFAFLYAIAIIIIVLMHTIGKVGPIVIVLGAFFIVGLIMVIVFSKAQFLRRQREVLTVVNSRLEEADLAKNNFLAMMSHEIRTPMNGIVSMSSMILETELSSDQRRFATIIRNSADALMTIINDILDLSKIDAGKTELEHVDFNLYELVDDLINTFAFQVQSKGLELLYSIDSEVPVLFNGDPGRLRQILVNLLGNALKFTENGRIMVTCRSRNVDGSLHTLAFTVEDTGIGISPDKVAILFNVFTQADNSIKRKYGGTGLGLTICKRITAMMGGEISVESEAGKGSRFHFTVQLKKADVSPVLRHQPACDLRGIKILVVEDNESILEQLLRYLTEWGMIPIPAHSSEEALQVLETQYNRDGCCPVVLIDMLLPALNGAALGKAIKADTRFSNIKMIVMTSIAARGDSREFTEIGFQAYLTKPINPYHLESVLKSVLATDGNKENGLITRHDVSSEINGRYRILLAEDNITNQEVAKILLHKLGITTVDIVSDGAQALRALERSKYDLVLMDISMPEYDGLYATGRIRDITSGVLQHDIPIIAMTASAMDNERKQFLDAGMNDYLSKPINYHTLRNILRKWLPEKDNLFESDAHSDQIADEQGGEAHDAVFNYRKVLELMSNDETLTMRIMRVYLTDIPRQMKALREAIAANDIHEITLKAHTIKGASGYLALTSLQKTAALIEEAGQNNDSASIAPHFAMLEEICRRAEKEIAATIAELSSQ